MNNDTNDTENQFRLYEYHINNKDISECKSHDNNNAHHNSATESTFDRDDNEESCINQRKIFDRDENLTKTEPTDQEHQIFTPSIPKSPRHMTKVVKRTRYSPTSTNRYE